MKTSTSSCILSSLFLLGVPCFTTSATSPSDPIQMMPAAAKYSSLHAHRFLRDLQLSQTCEDAIDGLSDNEVFRVANATKFGEIETLDITPYCSSSSNKLYCNLHYDDLRSHDQYADACEGAGGCLVPAGFGLHCSGDGATVEFVINDQGCLPSVCSAEEYDQELERVEQELANELARELGSSGSCRINVEDDIVTSGTASTNDVFGLSVAALLGALVTMMHAAI